MATKAVELPAFIELSDGRFVTWSEITREELSEAIALVRQQMRPLKDRLHGLLWGANHFDHVRATIPDDV